MKNLKIILLVCFAFLACKNKNKKSNISIPTDMHLEDAISEMCNCIQYDNEAISLSDSCIKLMEQHILKLELNRDTLHQYLLTIQNCQKKYIKEDVNEIVHELSKPDKKRAVKQLKKIKKNAASNKEHHIIEEVNKEYFWEDSLPSLKNTVKKQPTPEVKPKTSNELNDLHYDIDEEVD